MESIDTLLNDIKNFVKHDEAMLTKVSLLEKQINFLLSEQDFLECLRQVGVDNWSGYPEAWDMFDNGEEENECD